MENVGIFLDVGNLYHTCKTKFGRKINFQKLYDFCTSGNITPVAIAYGVGAAKNKGFKQVLLSAGFEVNFKTPKTFADGTKKADQDLTIAADIFRNMKQFDTIVLGSADGDFAPVLQLCNDIGKKTFVIGCGISHELKEVANGYQEIGESLLEQLP